MNNIPGAPDAKKSLGQHWLHDEASLRAMADAAGVVAGGTVLEIGPGLGTLTAELLRRGAKVVAVEFDTGLARDLLPRVQKLLRSDAGDGVQELATNARDANTDVQKLTANLQIVQQDIMQFDLRTLPAGYKVAANIPYYLTSHLLRMLCESAQPFSRAALLVQKEVAERVCAAPGDLSVLALSVQFYCEASLGKLVPAELFTPPPKVDSQILQLTRRAEPLFAEIEPRAFFRIIKAGFAQRRKTLLNSLAAGLQLDRTQTATLLAEANITPNTRAQNLSLADWHRLYTCKTIE